MLRWLWLLLLAIVVMSVVDEGPCSCVEGVPGHVCDDTMKLRQAKYDLQVIEAILASCQKDHERDCVRVYTEMAKRQKSVIGDLERA
jgi:hypothetical protein